MARKRGKVSHRQPEAEEVDLDEVDAFNEEREKILLNESGIQDRHQDEQEDDQEDVMSLGESDSENDFDFRNNRHMDEEEEDYYKSESEAENGDDEDKWGSRNDYYGADDIEEEEDAKLLEEEAIRLQKKHLAELNIDDFMDEDYDEGWEKKAVDEGEEVSEPVSVTNVNDLDTKERLELLKTAYPEFLPLTREFSSLKPVWEQLKSSQRNEVGNVKFTALSTYLGTIGTYLATFMYNLESGEQFSMKDEPVMEGILHSREIWRQASELPDIEVVKKTDIPSDYSSESGISDDQGVDVSESESGSDSASEDVDDEGVESDNSDITFDILSKRRTIKALRAKGDDADEVDQEEKKGRRKTLRFYTSKIDQKENKIEDKYTGDADIPYRERLYERQQKLIEEARLRGEKGNSNAPGVDLDDNEYDSADEALSKRLNEDADESYYNAVASARKGKTDARRRAHEEAVTAAREGTLAEIESGLGEAGKRAIGYQILKNKGLGKSRKKENRNARVKKRKKYDKAQKKLKSVRAVYTGQQGAYSGEKTGIKKGLARSVKLA
ncbi:unnamed protein product [Kuraishia capsulata CBS 1993]|uniref:Sas10 C-terminal domain-containing protein n=1 Tax=Kuraishia capsulata CBS 1993 TaxID=1382522 RepID=W6MK92_9ASCO|nr:uncharacterized protein KUCA_T00000994001 [Kuraishia capsulata CBS 1993]CDK25027.1 unnamed protein product [Kuraishia capsulata CBS 1993]